MRALPHIVKREVSGRWAGDRPPSQRVTGSFPTNSAAKLRKRAEMRKSAAHDVSRTNVKWSAGALTFVHRGQLTVVDISVNKWAHGESPLR